MRATPLVPTVLLAFALALAAGAGVAGAQVALPPELVALDKTSGAWADAFNKGDLDALTGLYSEMAILFPPGSKPVEGREAIRAFWAEALGRGNRITFDNREIDQAGHLAFKTGTLTVTDSAGETIDEGSYVEIWAQGEDGWELFRDIWTSHQAP